MCSHAHAEVLLAERSGLVKHCQRCCMQGKWLSVTKVSAAMQGSVAAALAEAAADLTDTIKKERYPSSQPAEAAQPACSAVSQYTDHEPAQQQQPAPEPTCVPASAASGQPVRQRRASKKARQKQRRQARLISWMLACCSGSCMDDMVTPFALLAICAEAIPVHDAL